jgi:hypothetical protein
MPKHLGERSEEVQEAHRFRARLFWCQDFTKVLLPALDEGLDLLFAQRHPLSVSNAG